MYMDMGLGVDDIGDRSMEIKIRIAEIDAQFNTMLKAISADTIENFNEGQVVALLNKKTNRNKKTQNLDSIKSAQHSKNLRTIH